MAVRSLLGGATVAFAISLTGCAHHATSDEQPPVAVLAASPRQARFVSTLDLSGTVSAPHRVTVGATTSGRIIALRVQTGEIVSRGDTLAQIDSASYQAALTQAQGATNAAAASRRLALAQVEAAQSRLRLAEATARRMSVLYAQGAIAKQQQDETQADLQAARAGVAQAQASVAAAAGQVAQSQGSVAGAEVPLRNTVVRAPFSGVVTDRLADVGAVVTDGSPIVTIEDDRDLEVDVSAPENATPSLQTGSAVPLRVDALGERQIDGRIRAVISSTNATSHSVLVKIAVPRVTGMLPGMYVRVSLPARGHFGTAIPASALATRAGQDGVFTLRDGRAHFVPVDTGATSAGLIEIHGLPAGSDVVAASNVERLTDGAAVSVQRQ